MISFKQFLAEAAYASLYHATPLENLESIFSDGGLYSENGKISTARSINSAKWYAGHEFSLYNSDFVILQLDQNKIRQRYKVSPYDYFNTLGISKLRRKEAEEVISVPTHTFLDLKYITKIYYFRVDKQQIEHFFNRYKSIEWRQL